MTNLKWFAKFIRTRLACSGTDDGHVGNVLHHQVVHLMLRARSARPQYLLCLLFVAFATVWDLRLHGHAAELGDALELFQAGDYLECVELAGEAIEAGAYQDDWRIYKIRSELASGDYRAARATLETALQMSRFRRNIRLRWLGATVYRLNSQAERAEEMLDQIDELTDGAGWRYSDRSSRVTLGRFFLERGADPKTVLDSVYNDVKNRSRRFSAPYVAAGELALAKHDYQLAAEEYEAALEIDPGDPGIQFGLARAYAESDGERAEQHLRAALARNPHHVDSLLFLVDNHVDAERYGEARGLLLDVLAVNPNEPRGWAYRSLLAHLENRPVDEEVCRQMALAWSSESPIVDSLIGRKLSQKYRFAEGAEYQRRALALDPDYAEAKVALCQDLLRLGEEERGWELASEIYEDDGYNVVAHNLVTLHDRLAGYRTIESEHFVVRMDPQEAEIYGDRVMRLLARARSCLAAKYEIEISEPVLVEIFPQQGDFAIRTFGLPGGAGFLGVCFGGVITANSPASQTSHPSNWESVLWHEYCHVVTLKKTRNKMPRWLSEGISVYEEREANASWGQSLTPQYREMILGSDLTPVSQLSAAFLQPKSPLHLQFAYFESSLVVRYLVEKYGLATLKRILVDLGVGMPINESLRRYTGSLEALDEEFADYARQRAKELAPGIDWQQPPLPATATAGEIEAWNADHPDSYWGLKRIAAKWVQEQRWAAAKQPLERLIALYPDDAAEGNPYAILARVHRELNETKDERAVLESLASRSANSVDAYLRLMELANEAEDWEALRVNAERQLAVNPLQKAPHRFLAEAAEQLDDAALAVEGLRVLALMEPHDPADIHFRLADHLHRLGRLADARLHILQSLEEAPRFRAAHRKLLEILAELGRTERPTASTPEEAAERESDT